MVRRGSGYGQGKTPDAPVVQKVQVKKNDVRIVLNSRGEELDGYDVVAARSKNGKEPSDYIKVNEWVFRKQ